MTVSSGTRHSAKFQQFHSVLATDPATTVRPISVGTGASFAALPAETGWRRECAVRRPFDVAVRQQAQPVVVEVAEAVSDALYLLDQEVDRFGGSVGDPVGVEVGQQLAAPGVGGAGQPFELGDTGVGALHEPGV